MTTIVDPFDLPWVDPDESDLEHLKPGARARCYDCPSILIAKCGEINKWHWAHPGDAICSHDGEGAWHRAWKQWCANQGAAVESVSHPHRADVKWPDGRIWELQRTYTDGATIRKREDHYGEQLTWVYRWLPGRWNRLWNIGDGWFRWAKPAPSMALHRRPVIWHHLDRLYEVTTRVTDDGDVHIRFARGEDDKYGAMLYGSKPAPFHVGDAVDALKRFERERAA